MRIPKTSQVYTQPLEPIEPVKLSTGQKIRSLLSFKVGKLAIKVEALQKVVTKQYTALGHMTVQLQNMGKVPSEELKSFEEKLKTLQNQVDRLSEDIDKLSPKSQKTAKVKTLISNLDSLKKTIKSLETSKRKTALLAAGENEDLAKIADRIEQSRAHLQNACKKTKIPLDSSWQLHQAMCEVEKLEKELENKPTGSDARKVVQTMKANIEAKKSAILQLTAQEMKLKEGLLTGSKTPNKKNAMAINRLLAKILVQADHFSHKSDKDVDGLIQVCQPAIAASGKLKDLLEFHRVGKPIYDVMLHIDDAIDEALEAGNLDLLLAACKKVPELLKNSKVPEDALEAVVYITTQEYAAFNGEIDNKERQAELILSMWKKSLIDLSPNYHAKSEQYIPILQGILHKIKELGIEKSPVCQMLLKAQRALEVEPKQKSEAAYIQASMRKFGELHSSMKQNLKDLEHFKTQAVSERTGQLVALCITRFKNVLSQFNKEIHLEDIDTAFDTNLRPILQLRKEYVEAYTKAGTLDKLNSCSQVLKVGNNQEFQELLYTVLSLIDALVKEKAKSVDLVSCQQKLVTFMTGTVQELLKDLLHNAPVDSERRANLLDAFTVIQKVNTQISI